MRVVWCYILTNSRFKGSVFEEYTYFSFPTLMNSPYNPFLSDTETIKSETTLTKHRKETEKNHWYGLITHCVKFPYMLNRLLNIPGERL